MRVAALCLRAETPGVAPVSMAHARPTLGAGCLDQEAGRTGC